MRRRGCELGTLFELGTLSELGTFFYESGRCARGQHLGFLWWSPDVGSRPLWVRGHAGRGPAGPRRE